MDSLLISDLTGCLEDTFESNQGRALELLKFIRGSYENTEDSYEKEFEAVEISFNKAMSYLKSSDDSELDHPIAPVYSFLNLLNTPRIAYEVITGQGAHTLDEEVDIRDLVLGDLFNSVCDLLETHIKTAQNSITQAAVSTPIYPLLVVLRFLIREIREFTSEWLTLITDLLNLTCNEIFTVVCPVVCHSSPEGYIPEESSDVRDSGERSCLDLTLRPDLPQYLVTCCWRTVKEISLMYAELITAHSQNGSMTKDGVTGILSHDQIGMMKDCYEYILLNAKHRGAFELAYTGYTEFWKAIRRIRSEADLITKFFTEGPYEYLTDTDKSDQLCSTRRSAGLPFLLLSFLTSEEQTCNIQLEQVMSDLRKLTSQITDSEEDSSTSVNQTVHSLNCLRFIFRTSELNHKIHNHVVWALKTALHGYDSQLWSVRNSSTLLIAALITRMFGVKHQGQDDLSKSNGMSARLFFHKYPGIKQLLLKELTESTDFQLSNVGGVKLQPRLYVILLIMCKIYPSTKDDDVCASLTEFIPLIIRSGASPIYKTRLLAARTLSNNLRVDQYISTLDAITERFRLHVRGETNFKHGLLLQLTALLETSGNSSQLNGDISSLYIQFISTHHRELIQHRCSELKQTYCNLLKTCIQYYIPILTLYPEHTAPSVKESIQYNTDLLRLRADEALSRVSVLLQSSELNPTKSEYLEIFTVRNHYELHQLILDRALAGDIKLCTELLVSIFNIQSAWVASTQRNTHLNTLYKVSLILSDTSESSTLDNINIDGLHHMLSIEYNLKSVPVIKLCARVFMSSEKLRSCLTYESILNKLNEVISTSLDNEDYLLCIDVLEILVEDTQYVHQNTELMEIYLRCLIIITFTHSEYIRSQAAPRAYKIIKSLQRPDNELYKQDTPTEPDGTDSHSVIFYLINTIELIVYEPHDLRDFIFCKWENLNYRIMERKYSKNTYWNENITHDLPSKYKREQKLFTESSPSLLCDLDYFYKIVGKKIAFIHFIIRVTS